MESILEWIKKIGEINSYLLFTGTIVFSLLVFWLIKKVMLSVLLKVVKRSKTQIDDFLLDSRLFQRMLWALPLIIVYNASYLVPEIQTIIHNICTGLLVLVFVLGFSSLLNALNDYYNTLERFHGRSIKGFLEVIKIVAFILSGFVIIGMLTGQSPWALVSGVGALTAVILLIFRDTILSLVASLQITTNDLVRVGDWITVPKFGADGDVIDIALHTVKIQNWDKTITVIPTHKLLDETFKNWRGMKLSGGRRIKRAIHIDMNSIKFCDESMLKRFEKMQLISDYIITKSKELDAFNLETQVDPSNPVNSRKLTNIGTLRKYIELYIRNNSHIHPELTLMVRQLPSGPEGLPLEIYVFTNTTDWVTYEGIQDDIFDHIISIVPQFDLKIFQNPSGSDFQRLVKMN